MSSIPVERFESLGHNCEFGFVLRQLGSEESGMFRWAHVRSVDKLIFALDEEFAGLFANPQHLVPSSDTAMVEDQRLGIAFYTKLPIVLEAQNWVIRRDDAFAELHRAEHEKARGLAEAFLATLREAKRIFVYKENQGIGEDAMRRLHQALRRFGPVTLLVVNAAADATEAGRVAQLEDGLYHGAISRFSPPDAADQVDMEGWRQVLGNALALIDQYTGLVPGTVENGVLVGRDGCLFLAGGSHNVFNIVTGKDAIPEESFAAFRGNLQGRMAWAARNAVPYVHLIMPDKQSVVPELWPLTPPPLKLGGEYAIRNADLNAPILYPVAELAARRQQVVSRIDTHYRDAGSIVVAAMLAQRFSYRDESALRDSLLGQIGTSANPSAGDLGSKLSPPVAEKEDRFAAGDPGMWLHNEMPGSNNGLIDLRFNPAAPYRKRVASFGDSFGRIIARFLSFWFSEVYFFRSGFFHEEIMEQCRPDLLVTENIERYLDGCRPDEERPNFLLYPFQHNDAYRPSAAFTEALNAVLSYPRPPYRRFTEKLAPPPSPETASASAPAPKPASAPTPAPEIAVPAAHPEFDGLELHHRPEADGLLAQLEAPCEVPQKMPAFVIDLSGRGLHPKLGAQQKIHGSWLMQRKDVLLFGPTHLVSADGAWSCEARTFKQQYLDMLNVPYYAAIFGNGTPRIETDGKRNLIRAPDAIHEIDENVFLATPLEPGNWGRWIATVLPKAAQYHRYGEGRKFLCDARQPWQRDFLSVCGITDDQLLQHHPGQAYFCRDVMTVEYSPVNLTISEAERLSFFEQVIRHRHKSDGPKKIFLSRLSRSVRHPRYRVLQNEAALIDALAALGFSAVEPETLPVAEQIALFASAEQVVALGGAGLFNAAFCAPGTRIVDIESSASFVNGHAQLLSSLGMNYGILFGSQDAEDPEPVHKKWNVDVNGACAAIRAFMG